MKDFCYLFKYVVRVRWWPVVLLELMWNDPWWRSLLTFTFCCDNLWKSKFVALEKPGKLRDFFLLFCGHPGWVSILYFQHWRFLVQGWMLEVLGSKGQSSRWQCSPTCWKVHFLALLTWYLESYWTGFHQTFSNDALLDKDECFSFGGHRSKVTITMWPKVSRQRHT